MKHVIVCGHYQCGGVHAAMGDQSFGLVDHWLAGIRETVRRHRAELEALADDKAAQSRRRPQRPPAGGQPRAHADRPERLAARPAADAARVVYDIHDGLLKELALEVDGEDKVETLLRRLDG